MFLIIAKGFISLSANQIHYENNLLSLIRHHPVTIITVDSPENTQ
jgi:PII-like signaling protein